MNVRPRARACLAAAGLFSLWSLSGCDEKLSDITGPSPNLTVTFSSIRSEIFDSTDSAGRTACVTCHSEQGLPAARILNLRADPYTALVSTPSRQKAGATLVVPGNPDESYLIHKLEGRSSITGLRMPRNGPPYLTQGQLAVIRRWIEIGAPNN